jgi:WD40 repeat protein
LIRELAGQTKPLALAVFSQDGTMLLTGGFDSTLRLWDARTGALLRELPKEEGYVSDAAFSPDGNRLASVYGYSVARI